LRVVHPREGHGGVEWACAHLSYDLYLPRLEVAEPDGWRSP
jgi:hypothetical protein